MRSRKAMPIPCSTHFIALRHHGIEKFTQTSSHIADLERFILHFTRHSEAHLYTNVCKLQGL